MVKQPTVSKKRKRIDLTRADDRVRVAKEIAAAKDRLSEIFSDVVDHLKTQGETQTAIASDINVDASKVSKLCNGAGGFSIEVIIRFLASTGNHVAIRVIPARGRFGRVTAKKAKIT